jgi:hypothetical protein
MFFFNHASGNVFKFLDVACLHLDVACLQLSTSSSILGSSFHLEDDSVFILTLSSACGFYFEMIDFFKLLQKRSAFILSLGDSVHLFSYVALPRFLCQRLFYTFILPEVVLL